MSEELTLLCVHAHPDDESSSTGGVLRISADEGIRTVLVTCTDGALGDGVDGTKPEGALEEDADESATPPGPGHRPEEVAVHREEELRTAAKILGVSRLEMLRYADSGMEGWPQNKAPNAFWNTPVDEAAERLVPILLEERPQVVVTYDANGFYGHPDHIQANRITVAALDKSGLDARLLYTAIPKSAFKRFRVVMQEAGIEGPGSDGEDPPFGTPDEDIGLIVDISAASDAKFDALSAHSSQTDDSFFLKMGRERFRELFRNEYFIRVRDPFNRTGIDHDLFAGWRG